MSSHSDSVRRYYDANTRLFLLADLGGTSAIHREVWAPGTTTRAQAAGHVHERLAHYLPSNVDLIDLGCGVGATSRFLAEQLNANVTGITISPVQAETATKRAHARCRFLVRDFLSIDDLGPFGGALAIESFSHAADADRFFASVGGVLTKGATLCICDDFVAPGEHSRETETRYARLRRGWHFESFMRADEAIALATKNGFSLRAREDFTPHLRVKPAWLLNLLARTEKVLRRVPVFGESAFVDNWEGGTALQELALHKESTYELLVFGRQ